MNHDDDAREDQLARINLHAWRVPPPSAADRSSILTRALAPPRNRSRMAWLFAALAIANVVLAAIIVIVVSQRPATTVSVQPAGGAVDARTTELLRRLDQDQRELERKLADVQQLRTLVVELEDRVRQCESDRRDRTVPKPREPAEPAEVAGCDEVSCVLSNYAGACCAKFRRAAPPPTSPVSKLPDTLDRHMISAGIDTVRARVAACGQHATGLVKVRIRVAPSGHVADVVIVEPRDPSAVALTRCVASVLQQATFDPTHHGGSFSYPFVFGASP
jgi:hypothetical protein